MRSLRSYCAIGVSLIGLFAPDWSIAKDPAIELFWAEDSTASETPRSAALARVAGDAPYYLTSGSVAAPSDPDREWGDPDRWGDDLETQTRSTLFQLSYNLADIGLTPREVAFLRAYVVIEENGTLNLEGFWQAYDLFFGTAENPSKPPVSIVPVPALALPGLVVEIEWVATSSVGIAIEPLEGAESLQLNPQVVSLAQPGSAIAQGKALKPYTSLYFASGNIPAPANPEDPISEWRIEGDYYEQSKGALSRIQDGLRDKGLSFADVVFLRCFLVHDPSESFGEGSAFGQWNKAYSECFNLGSNPNRPARSTLMVSPFDLEGMLLEIEVIAAYPDPSGPFPVVDSIDPNPNLISYGPPHFPIAEGKAVSRRAPLYWSGSILPSDSSDDLTAQAVDILSQASELLEAQGLSVADIVFLRVYGVPDVETGMIDRPAWNAAYEQFFGTESQPIKPARTFLPVPSLPDAGAGIAIDFIAAGRE